MSRKIKSSEQQVQQPRHELLLVAETVAREKGIEKEEILEAMELAIQKTARQKYGADYDIRVTIDRDTGDIELFQCETVVDVVENNMTEISLDHAHDLKPDAVIGDIIREPLQPVEFGRVAAQTARQVIVQKVREAERIRQYEEYKDRVGEILSGTVKRVEFGNVYVDLGHAEGILKKDGIIPRENLRVGDRVRVFLVELKVDNRGPIALLSRTHPGFMAKLFEQEVPEIDEGVIEIKSVARDPGSRAKMSVFTSDISIDPVGSCVGLRGSRVQAIVNELQGEKVDIITWSEDTPTYIVNALQPADVMKVVIDEEDNRVSVVVEDDQLSLAIGRRGQNVRLASHLTGWNIDITTEEDDQARIAAEQNVQMDVFKTALDVDDTIAQLLVVEGFTQLEDVAYIEIEEISSIESFGPDLANELQSRARNYLETRLQNVLQRAQDMDAEQGLLDLFQDDNNRLDIEMLDKILLSDIAKLDDFAELSGDDLLDIIGHNSLSQDEANDLIMQSRAHWFTEDNA